MKIFYYILPLSIFISGCANNHISNDIPPCDPHSRYNIIEGHEIVLLALEAQNSAYDLNFYEAKKKHEKLLGEIEKSKTDIKNAIDKLDLAYDTAIRGECKPTLTYRPFNYKNAQNNLIVRLREIENATIVEETKEIINKCERTHKFYLDEGRSSVTKDEIEVRLLLRNPVSTKIRIKNLSENIIKKLNMKFCRKYVNTMGGEDCAWIPRLTVYDQYGNDYKAKANKLPFAMNLFPKQSIVTDIDTGFTVEGSNLTIIFNKNSLGSNDPLKLTVPALPE